MTFKKFWHKIYIDPRRRRKMRKWGLPMLDAIDRIMSENSLPYSLIYGTLLGGVREKGFIPHDNDVDIALWADVDYSKAFSQMEKEGFVKLREILVDDGKTAYEQTLKFHSIHVDFFYFFPEGEGKYYGSEFFCFDDCSSWAESIRKHGGLKMLKYHLPVSKKTEYIAFEDRKYQATVDAMSFVEEYYGPNWRIPDPTFVYPRKGETVYDEMPGKTAILKSYR